MKENSAILRFKRSTLFIENYSQNQWSYLQNQCNDLIKNQRFNKKQTESSKTKTFTLKWGIFNTNPNNIKLQMLLEGLKYKQLEGNTIYIIQRELTMG